MTRKLAKVTNEHLVTCCCTETISLSFLVILLLFAINMIKKCLEQKYRTLNTKTCQKWKPTQDNYIFHPNLLHIIFGHFCCCFASIWLKNITIKSLSHFARKLVKVTNQHLMTCFCFRTSFSVILLLFHINMVKICSEQKYSPLYKVTCKKWKPSQADYVFHTIYCT